MGAARGPCYSLQSFRGNIKEAFNCKEAKRISVSITSAASNAIPTSSNFGQILSQAIHRIFHVRKKLWYFSSFKQGDIVPLIKIVYLSDF